MGNLTNSKQLYEKSNNFDDKMYTFKKKLDHPVYRNINIMK